MKKFNPAALAMAVGLLQVLLVLLVVIFAGLFEYAKDLLNLMSTLYFGLDTTFSGIIVGMFWAFVDGFVAGAIIAWLYNYFARE